MAKMTTEELLAIFEEMSVLELKEFLDAFEEKFDVTAAAPMAIAAAHAGGGDGGGSDEEKDSFNVVLAASIVLCSRLITLLSLSNAPKPSSMVTASG